MDNLPRDKTSAFYRKLNPDEWIWSDANAVLLAEIATVLSDLRWMEAAARVGVDEIPDRWQMRTYGPPRASEGDEQQPEVRSLDEKRAIAERARRRAIGA